MGLAEALEVEKDNQRLSHELRVACDRLNEAITLCVRNGLQVDVELIDVTTPDEPIMRFVVKVNPQYVIRY